MALLVAFALVGLAAGGVVKDASLDSLVETDYHNKIGIPLATQLKADEDCIVGGQHNSLGGKDRFIGGIIITLTTGQTSVCGSSLLGNTLGVTAAHCWRTLLAQARSFTVVYGSNHLFYGGTSVTTTDVETHANYNMTTLVNDIAIIRHPWVSFSYTIRPVALATGSYDYAGALTWAATWGRTTTDDIESKTDGSLWHVIVTGISNAECQATYGSSIQASNLCVATTGSRGLCIGGSGGPLRYGNSNRLIGVMSFGHNGGCQGNSPAVFTRVSAFAAWLEARLASTSTITVVRDMS